MPLIVSWNRTNHNLPISHYEWAIRSTPAHLGLDIGALRTLGQGNLRGIVPRPSIARRVESWQRVEESRSGWHSRPVRIWLAPWLKHVAERLAGCRHRQASAAARRGLVRTDIAV